MARQKKMKKMQMPRALDGAKDFIFKRIAVISVVAVFMALSWILITAFFERSDYFKLRAVDVRGASDKSLVSMKSELLRLYKDNNIFRINLQAIAKSLESRFPDAKYIIAKRALPDKLVIDLSFRKPVAILSNGRSYPIDREGVILVNRDLSLLKNLPVVKGVDPKFAGRFHKRCGSRSLLSALDLIAEIKSARFLDKYQVNLIDASDIKSLSFYLGANGPIVIIGYENFKERLSALRDTLRDPRLVLDSINYIDVRFRDIAISPK